jgi:hypothetical protein
MGDSYEKKIWIQQTLKLEMFFSFSNQELASFASLAKCLDSHCLFMSASELLYPNGCLLDPITIESDLKSTFILDLPSFTGFATGDLSAILRLASTS